jgi:hypothetical protein
MRLVICGPNRKASPSPSPVRLVELASVNVCVLEIFGLPLFSQRSFLMSPSAFLGLPLFSSEVFVISPFAFLGLLLFSSEVFVISPFAFLGLPLFSTDVFEISPFAFFRVASFFIGGLWDKPICIFWGCLFFH